MEELLEVPEVELPLEVDLAVVEVDGSHKARSLLLRKIKEL